MEKQPRTCWWSFSLLQGSFRQEVCWKHWAQGRGIQRWRGHDTKDGEDMTPMMLMHLTSNKYKTCKDWQVWDASMKENEKIIALEAELKWVKEASNTSGTSHTNKAPKSPKKRQERTRRNSISQIGCQFLHGGGGGGGAANDQDGQ